MLLDSKYKILPSSRSEMLEIDETMKKFNHNAVPFTQKERFVDFNRHIRNEKGEIIAGINTTMYLWHCLFVDTLWVREDYRTAGLGTLLMQAIEKEAKEQGCYLAHVDTFDFQARGFYEKNGYTLFGTLENCPKGHQRFYLKKEL